MKGRKFLANLVGQDETSNLSFLFFVGFGIIIFGVAGNVVYDILKGEGEKALLPSLTVLIALLILYRIYQRIIHSKNRLVIDVNNSIQPMPYIISGMSSLNDSTNNIELVQNLVNKHLSALRCLYLLESSDGGVQKYKRLFTEWYGKQGYTFPIEYIQIEDGTDIDSTYRTITLKLQSLEKEGISLKNMVLIDITAGTKAITAGLTMASLANGCNMTYQATQHNNGQFVGDTKWQFFKNHIVQIWEIPSA